MHALKSLYSMLLKWASTEHGSKMLASVPRSQELDGKLMALSTTLRHISGHQPNSDQLSEAFMSIC